MTSAMETRQLYGGSADGETVGERFREGEIPVAVYGLGKMGLPIASVFASVCRNVTGVDVDPSVVETVNDGASHVEGEPGLPELVSETVAAGALEATTDGATAAADASVHAIIVPTLLTDDGSPDLSVVRSVLEDVAAGLAPGDLVVVESTVPPRTCEDVVVPTLAAESGLDPDEFGVAFCPERTASGRALVDVRQSYPKIVGGVDAESTRVAAAIYDQVTENEVVTVSDATTAEAVKVFGGVYRDVNIALANEFAGYADALGVDVREAIEASNTNPYSNVLQPGPGVGGHCIPVYPHFLLEPFDVRSPLVRMARSVNDGVPVRVVRRLRRELEAAGTELSGATVLVLGVTYRAGVAETRNSPALDALELLSSLGAEAVAVDPMLDDVEGVAELLSQDDAAARDLDAVVLVTPHEEFERFDWDAHEDLVVLDTRGVLDESDFEHRLETVGRPSAARSPKGSDRSPERSDRPSEESDRPPEE